MRNQEQNLLKALSFALRITQSHRAALKLLYFLLPVLEFSRFPEKWIEILTTKLAIHISPNGKDKLQQMESVNAQAKLYLSLGRANLALELFEKWRHIFLAQDAQFEIIKAYLLQARSQFALGETKLSAHYLDLAIMNSKNLPENSITGVMLNRIVAQRHYYSGDLKKTKFKLLKASELAGKRKDKLSLAKIGIEMASLLLQEREYGKASKHLNKALHYLKEFSPLVDLLTRIDILRWIVHVGMGNRKMSRAFMKRANGYMINSRTGNWIRHILYRILELEKHEHSIV